MATFLALYCSLFCNSTCYFCPPGVWSSPITTGERPPPCAYFSLISIDYKRAVMFGGYHSDHGYMDYVYIIDLQSMVRQAFKNITSCVGFIEHVSVQGWHQPTLGAVWGGGGGDEASLLFIFLWVPSYTLMSSCTCLQVIYLCALYVHARMYVMYMYAVKMCRLAQPSMLEHHMKRIRSCG